MGGGGEGEVGGGTERKRSEQEKRRMRKGMGKWVETGDSLWSLIRLPPSLRASGIDPDFQE